MVNDKITVEIKNSEAIIFSGEAKSLSSINEDGPFDILPFHANFFSIIKEKIMIINQDDKKTEIPINDKGIMRVMENKISVFLGIETIELQ
jgi:F0F1-type ATP synthase epsilon subunit